jgi:hypothetical protein
MAGRGGLSQEMVSSAGGQSNEELVEEDRPDIAGLLGQVSLVLSHVFEGSCMVY